MKLNEPRAFVPPLDGEARAVYERAVLDAWASYSTLAALLKDDTFRILKELRYVTPRASAERLAGIAREAEKKAIEVARYVIPLAAFTAMVHTVSGITLYRLWRMAASGDAPHETTRVVAAMVDAVRAHDPQFFDRVAIEPLLPGAQPESVSAAGAARDAWARSFDERLGGRTSRLVDAPAQGEALVADAVRAVFGLDARSCRTSEAIERVMNPARNPYRLDTLNVSYHSPLMRALHHANYTFAKRLSHTADSQDQRHRMVPASRPLLAFADTREPDYVTPPLVAANPGGAGGVRRADAPRVGREEPVARARRAARVRPLRAAQRQGRPLPRDRPADRARAQVDDADVLQRAGGDLPRVDGRGGAGARGAPARLGGTSGRRA